MPDAILYKVTFNGQLVSGVTELEVQQNLANLFKSSGTTITKLFSGKTITIKKNLSKDKALAYQKTLYKVGAIAQIKSMKIDESAIQEGTITNDETEYPKDNQLLTDNKLQPPPQIDEEINEFDQLEAPPPAEVTNAAGPLGIPPAEKWLLEPAGTRMSKPKRKSKKPSPLTNHIKLSPANTEVGQTEHQVNVVKPDISHLNIAKTGERLSDNIVKENHQVPDLSHMEMAEAGEDVGQAIPTTEQLNPNTSDYSLAESTGEIPQLKHEKELVDPDISQLSIDEE